MGHLLGIMGEFVGNNRIVVQALPSRIIGTFWSILTSPLNKVPIGEGVFTYIEAVFTNQHSALW